MELNKNIFTVDQKGNTLYRIWKHVGKTYIVNDSKQQDKLIAIENYRYFILSYKAPIIIPIIIFSMIISLIGKFAFAIQIDVKALVILITVSVYTFIVLIYLFRLHYIANRNKDLM